MIVRCEMCFTDIGTCDPATLRTPLTGAMFGPLRAGYFPPFPVDASWEGLLCPICGKRAVGHDPDRLETFRTDRILTPEGYFVVEGAGKRGRTDGLTDGKSGAKGGVHG